MPVTSFNPFRIAFDAWRVTHGSQQMLAHRQQKRLSEIVAFARSHSRLYGEKYRGLPETITDVRRNRASRARSMHLIPVTLPIPEIVDRLNELQPAMLSGYASALAILAQEQLAGKLRLQPSIVVSSAEPLTGENRALIQQAFGIPPRNNYSCSEGGVMGYECRQGKMHLNADWVLYEPVDENYQPVASGRFSSRVLCASRPSRPRRGR